MLVWPSVAVLGFVLLAGVVILLGTSSTARYEFERNRVQGQRQQTTVPAAAQTAPVPGVPVDLPGGDQLRPVVSSGGAAAQEARLEPAAAVGVAAHPAGTRLVERGATPAWWLVDAWGDQRDEQVVAGPFPDRIEAEWAALSGNPGTSHRAVYGALRTDGGVLRRQSPQERAWLSELGDQLDRLAEDWDDRLSDDDALVTLVVEVAAALVEAGLTVHDCAGDGAAGGACLTPEPARGGVLVSWHQHDRMSRDQVRGAAIDASVQRTMNAAVADCLSQMGFDVEPFGSSGCSLVTAAQEWW
jgi:hypothetical protein